MRDCPNSIPTPAATPTTPDPHTWERRHGFREVTLAFFPPEDAAALRRAGHLLYDLVTDGKPYNPEPAESSTHHDLAAALVDLRYMESYLADIGRWPEEMGMSNADTRLALLAEDLAVQVGRVADSLQAGL